MPLREYKKKKEKWYPEINVCVPQYKEKTTTTTERDRPIQMLPSSAILEQAKKKKKKKSVENVTEEQKTGVKQNCADASTDVTVKEEIYMR